MFALAIYAVSWLEGLTEEVCKLVDAGFVFVCDFNGSKIFKKRK
jgi:hypothetical protein